MNANSLTPRKAQSIMVRQPRSSHYYYASRSFFSGRMLFLVAIITLELFSKVRGQNCPRFRTGRGCGLTSEIKTIRVPRGTVLQDVLDNDGGCAILLPMELTFGTEIGGIIPGVTPIEPGKSRIKQESDCLVNNGSRKRDFIRKS